MRIVDSRTLEAWVTRWPQINELTIKTEEAYEIGYFSAAMQAPATARLNATVLAGV